MAPSLENNPAFNRIPPWVKAKLRPQAIEIIQRVYDWVETECIPAERVVQAQLQNNRWKTAPLIHELRKKAKAQGLFNIFLPNHFKESPGLTNLEYACCAEIMGRCYWAAQTMNCHAPETGNIELLAKYCNDAQKEKWLKPLMDGDMSSAYSMTEPDRASSDATTIACSMKRDGDELVINGRKLYGNSQMNDELGIYILMGCSDPENPNPWARHTMVIVPARSKGLTMKRNLTIMGYDHAPEGHGEYVYENVRVPAANIILGEGRAFEIAQGRLGPGRIHHCMRLIGQTERAFELALIRCIDERKKPRGKLIGEFDSNIERVAYMRMRLDSMRQIVMNAADTMDIMGNKAGRYAIAQSKVLIPKMAADIIDECMQIWGGQGLTQYTALPEMWTYARFVRLADGPDSSHAHQVGRDQMKTAKGFETRHKQYQQRYHELCKQWNVEEDIF
ncbi:acyl-CoA dehydrogenase NM domain-like protein [Eremomyces bilateralis CBS 781.70]|uniref:Acyl-CoA dehydrogenase NM domain-like protein n=1 Tax=Eremomyces bilateralis CBS 781.70 TaxID=1392243 RepID=A0A6G1FYF8_9PEZI|nr:acyl-CoA dehydrogenase NM domain-like protein [Eremomyces bilateralis CBS 781.70]KAF1810752.1 acyl-CoA dehydrogenase NM domain-like protein [Eremomyces bilateralis CBS 781.70]